MNAKSLKPVRKVAAGGAAGAFTTVTVWVLSYYLHVEIPDAVAAAVTLLVMFCVSYLVPSGINELEGQ